MSPNKNTSPPHLLLVDDDRLVLSTLTLGLQQNGYRVSNAESAEEAEVFLASGERPDLAILDIRMSGNSGLQLAERLQQLDHIPFVILSAYSDQPMIDRATELGALAYLVKPMDIPKLVPSLEAALARANELQELRVTRQQLQAALDAERNINVAVGITMMQYHLKRTEAFAKLRNAARVRRVKLANLANDIVQAGEALNL
jgi:AmiR/NasT family two-component response regulator